jgi:hypothetical protein
MPSRSFPCDGLIDDRTDPLTLHKPVHDLNRARDISLPGDIPARPRRPHHEDLTETILKPSRSRRYWPMLYAMRSVLADKPTTAQVAGLVNNRLITSGSHHVPTAQILADPVGVQPPGHKARVRDPSHGYTADTRGRQR